MNISYSVVYVIDGEARTVVVADNVQALPAPVPCRGALKLWTVSEGVQVEVLSQLPVNGL